MGPEKQYEERVTKWLRSVGVYPIRYPAKKMQTPPCGYYIKRWGDGPYARKGLPDLQIVVNQRCLEVELKAEHGKPSADQTETVNWMLSVGGQACIIYPDDFEALKRVVRRMKGDNS